MQVIIISARDKFSIPSFPPNRWRKKKEEEKSFKMKTFKTVLSTIRDTTPCGSVSKTREWSARGELYPILERVRAARKTFLIPAPVAARDAAAPFLFLLPPPLLPNAAHLGIVFPSTEATAI